MQALDACSRILESDSENVDALVDRAETHILNEDFDMGNVLLVPGHVFFSPLCVCVSVRRLLCA